jgi:hypothetical protein
MESVMEWQALSLTTVVLIGFIGVVYELMLIRRALQDIVRTMNERQISN